MKNFGTLLLTLTIFGSSMAFADHHIRRTCIAAANAAGEKPLAFISAEEVIDEDTGLTSALLVSTTYTELKYCKAGLKGKMNTPTQPRVMNDVSESMKCYVDVNDNFGIFLVNETINLDTGLVSKLEIKNQFGSLEACQSWL